MIHPQSSQDCRYLYKNNIWNPDQPPGRQQAMKGGTQPIILMVSLVLVVVPWLCLASSAALASENVDAAAAALKLKAEYIKLNFSTASATSDKYKSFIASVRAGLVSTADGSNSSGIPVLVSEDDPLALDVFLNVTLVNKAGHSVSLNMDVSGAYFAAYVAGNYYCLLERSTSSGRSTSVSSVTCYRNSYPWGGPPTVTVDDDPAITEWRVPEDLDEAISSLFLFPTGNATKADLSRGLAAVDLMVATAATFPCVERQMSSGFWDGGSIVYNDGSLHGLQQSWPSLSAAVQESCQVAFAAPVEVQGRNGRWWLHVDNVRRAVPLVSFLKHASCNKTTRETVDQRRRLPLLIRSVVQQPDEEDMHQQLGRPTTAACGQAQAEPTVRLIGWKGMCMEVPVPFGKEVQLSKCRKYNSVNQIQNQFWTLKRDGTIRYNGKCLASGADGAGDSVVIDECPPRIWMGRVLWEVRADGTVALKWSSPPGLVLTARTLPESKLSTGLTVRQDDRSTAQSWTPTNETAPLAAVIIGFGDLCLQVYFGGTTMFVAACMHHIKVAHWSLYPDGSISPALSLQVLRQCVAADARGRVSVKYCDGAGSSWERWVFRNDGTILNTGTGMVLDVVRPSAGDSSGQVVVSPAATGSATQKWALLL